MLLPVRVRKCLAALSWENRSRSPIFTRNYVPSKSETGTAPVRRDSPYPHQSRAKQKFAQRKNRKMSSLIIPVFSLSETISISEARRAGKVSYPHVFSEIEIVPASHRLWFAARKNRSEIKDLVIRDRFSLPHRVWKGKSHVYSPLKNSSREAFFPLVTRRAIWCIITPYGTYICR